MGAMCVPPYVPRVGLVECSRHESVTVSGGRRGIDRDSRRQDGVGDNSSVTCTGI